MPRAKATEVLRLKAVRDVGRLKEALRQIADMDPAGERADDLGRAARIARTALADGVPVGSGGSMTGPPSDEQLMELAREECENFRWPSTALTIMRKAIAAAGAKENSNG